VGRKAQILLGAAFLAVICFWGAYRAGLLRRAPSAPTMAPAMAASTATLSIPAANPVPLDPPKIAESPFPATSSSLDDSDPDTFIALRYDQTHVFFRLGEKGDFTLQNPEQEKSFHRLAKPAAEYGTGQPFELEPAVFESVKEHYEPVHVGEQWQLEVSAGGRVPVTIQKPIEMAWGCESSFTAGFIAEIAPESQATFSHLPQKYFLVHKSLAASGSLANPKPMSTGELADWNPSPEIRMEIEQFITAKLRDQITRKDGAWWANPSNSNPDPRVKEAAEAWRPFIEKTAAGQGTLTYDMKTFLLSPDGVPRLYIRAMWKTGEDRALLMSRWLRLGTTIMVESRELDGTSTMWEERDAGESVALELSSLPTVLNVFDRPDGYGDVLILSPGYEGYSMVLYHYSTAGMSATNISMGDGC
jgi:hypothetical protein